MPPPDSGAAAHERVHAEPSDPATVGSAGGNPFARGPDPTLASVAAEFGPFATTQLSVPPGHGFNGGYVYYPTDASPTFGAVAIVPGYTALFADEEAWMGPRLASFGFVVIGIETNSREDWDRARGAQLLAALDYVTQHSTVRTRVDSSRLAVIGHSMGGGGAFAAATRRPSLKAVVGLAPYFPSGDLATVRVPTLIIGGQRDTTVTPSYLDDLYATLPTRTPSAYLMLADADHLFPTRPNPVEMRLLIPWLKIFVDRDTRYVRFLCPLADRSGIAQYRVTCPLAPPA
jgi:pimeloyl-ACP methyl ester carboxylesterase